MEKKLRRSIVDRKICGVCGGIGEYFDLDPTLVRLGWVFLSLFTYAFPGIIAYFIACLIIPE